MNSIIFLGVFLIAFSVFLLFKELTDRTSIALLSVIIVLASPKVIFYSSRLYMEILLSGLFVFTIFFLVRFVKTKSAKNLTLLAIFTAITASIKQQGLFILFPSILLFLFCFFIIDKRRRDKEKIQNKLSIKHIVIYFLIFLLSISPAYFVLFHNYGRITESSLEDFKIINLINRIGREISGYKKPVENIEFNEKWSQRLKEIRKEYYSTGVTRAEARHIYPLDPLTSWNGFIKTNSLYLENFRGGPPTKGLANLINFLMLSGLILFVLNIIFKNKILKFKYRDLQIYFLIFLLIFLVINYILFLRSSDQMRYHLFIPIIFSVFPAIGIYSLISLFILRNNFSIYIRIIGIFLILVILITPLIIFAYEDATSQKGWYKSQLYRESIGGIASVQEAGNWLNNHTNENDLIWQTCGSELLYYSERNVTGDFCFYFLNESELREIFKDQNIKYIVIFDSQIVLDEKWENLCWMPESFAEKIRKIYPEVYKTSFNDIRIYKV